MRVCIVGCGPSGLVAAKHLKTNGVDFDAFERSEKIGGTWVYTECTKDLYQEPVHTAMYKNLRTNFPKELMEFEGLHFSTDESFLPSTDVLQYLNDYANKFSIMENIKVGHKVVNVSRKNHNWFVTVEDLHSKTNFSSVYSHIIICNGHHFVPRFPNIEGMNTFKGLKLHSKDYRRPEIFKEKVLLVIGFSFSGQDITADASKYAKTIYVSHHTNNFKEEFFSRIVKPKPDVSRFSEQSVTFADGSIEDIDAVLYCTGYEYSFPFLDSSCGVTYDEDHVYPLYRHVFNINHPSMAFVGLNFFTIVFFVFEAQVKAIVKVFMGEVSLPSQDNMLSELKEYEEDLKRKNIIKKKYHMVQNERDYFQQIHQIGNIVDIPEVIYKMHYFNVDKRRNFVHNYRKWVYKVIDKVKFTAEFDENKY